MLNRGAISKAPGGSKALGRKRVPPPPAARNGSAAQVDLFTIEKRRRDVASLYRSRVSEREIAGSLNISLATVYRDIQVIMEEWRRQYLVDMNAYVVRDLADMDQMERDCAAQFAAGHQPIWILRRLQIKERRAALLGMDAPDKVDLEVWVREQAIAMGLNPDEEVRYLREHMQTAIPPADGA
jgi:DNA-binding CsgD family transcriptional regulator